MSNKVGRRTNKKREERREKREERRGKREERVRLARDGWRTPDDGWRKVAQAAPEAEHSYANERERSSIRRRATRHPAAGIMNEIWNVVALQ